MPPAATLTAFLDFARRFAPLTAAEAAACAAGFRAVAHRRRQRVQREGDLAEDVLFLESGLLRGYYLHPAGHDITASFYFGPTLVGDVAALREHRPTRLNLDVLEAGQLWRVRLADLETLSAQYPVLNRFFWGFFEQVYRFYHQRQLSFIYDSPTERYLKLLRERPKVVERVPQRYIASYLGLQPESLSRIRKRVAQGGFS